MLARELEVTDSGNCKYNLLEIKICIGRRILRPASWLTGAKNTSLRPSTTWSWVAF